MCSCYGWGTLPHMRTLLLFLLLSLAGCPGKPAKPAEETQDGILWCHQAQEHLLTDLECSDHRGARLGTPNKKGVAFEDICRKLYEVGVNFKAKCLAHAKTCEEVETVCVP